jgi:hypothetical protein
MTIRIGVIRGIRGSLCGALLHPNEIPHEKYVNALHSVTDRICPSEIISAEFPRISGHRTALPR